jgi:hypothetical protein
MAKKILKKVSGRKTARKTAKKAAGKKKVKTKKLDLKNKAVLKKKISAQKKEKLIGEIVHYFSNIRVAVVKLSACLAKGDRIRVVGGEETDFVQTVGSMEVEHQKISRAKAKSEIGLKIKKKVREGYKVYKI